MVYVLSIMAAGWLARYDYSLAQSLVIPLSLALAYCAASILLRDKLSLANIIGRGLAARR